jgi:putative acetyltransferase
MNEDEPFLKRWSRRKVEAREGPDKVEPARESADGDVGMPGDVSLPAQGEGRPQDKRELTEADFADVDFDALDAKSDYARFLAKGVPEVIKQKALRKLWASDPVFSQIEPLQEYAGDITDAAVAVPAGTLKTAYRVGKGFLSDEEVAAWEKLGHPAEPEKVATSPPVTDAPPSRPDASAGALAATASEVEPAVAIAQEPPDQPDVHALLRQSDAYFASLYPTESNHLVDIAALSAPNVRFVVARRGGIAVGCGALVLGANGEAELKRMFVIPKARGLKLGSRILDTLEAAARAEGVRVLRLETGVRQPEALGLYRRHGYTERGPFGTYRPDPLSTFFEKWIG